MSIKEYTKEEIMAIERKFAHPEEVVICPRCQKELEYKISITGTSEQVKCQTEGCLNAAIRGI